MDCEPQGYISTLWVLAGKPNYQQMFPGYDVSDIVNGGDRILEDEIVIILLQIKDTYIMSVT